MNFRFPLLSFLLLSADVCAHDDVCPRRLQDGECLSRVGSNLRGSQNNDWFGSDVSINLDGSVVAVGAPGQNNQSGRVQVFQNVNNQWQQFGDFEGENVGDYLSENALSDDGNVLAVGAEEHDKGRGCVRVYEYRNGDWKQRGITIVGLAVDDHFGWSVALSGDGNIMAVSAHNGENKKGQVRIFEWNGAEWVGKGNPLDGKSEDIRFGFSIWLSQDGTILGVGVRKNDDASEARGNVQIFERVDNNWVQLGQDLLGAGADDRFGYSVALSSNGQTVAVGAIGAETSGSFSGQVKVYRLEESNGLKVWSQLGQSLNGDDAEDWFGYSVSLSGDSSILVVGAPHARSNDRGLLRMFRLDGSIWEKMGGDVYGYLADDDLGDCVAISRDGSTVVAGGDAYNTGRPGLAVVYYVEETCRPSSTTPPTINPTRSPTQSPTESPTQAPTESPTLARTSSPTRSQTTLPTQSPTELSTYRSTTMRPTNVLTDAPFSTPTTPILATQEPPSNMSPTTTEEPATATMDPTDTEEPPQADNRTVLVGLIPGIIVGMIVSLVTVTGFFLIRRRHKHERRNMQAADLRTERQVVEASSVSAFPSVQMGQVVGGPSMVQPEDVLAIPIGSRAGGPQVTQPARQNARARRNSGQGRDRSPAQSPDLDQLRQQPEADLVARFPEELDLDQLRHQREKARNGGPEFKDQVRSATPPPAQRRPLEP